MVHVLYEGPKKDIVVAFDNTEDIEFEPQKEKKVTFQKQTKVNCRRQKTRAYYNFLNKKCKFIEN